MKKGLVLFAAPVAVTLVLGLAVYAAPATGGSTGLATRVTRLEAGQKRLAAANAKLAAANASLAKRVVKLEQFTSCNTDAGGISMPGDPASGSGYEYTPDNQATVTLMQALEPTPAGETPDDYIQLVSGKCVTGREGPARRVLGRLGRR